jgi:hypothetical protein
VQHSQLSPDAEPAWRAIMVVGAVLTAAGLTDQMMLWLPLGLAAPAWAFGTATTFFDTFPLLGLGLVFWLGAAVALGLRWTTRGLATACVLLALFLWLVAALYVRLFPQILRLATEPAVRIHVEKAAVKTGFQALMYPITLLVLALRAWRATRSPAPKRAANVPPSSDAAGRKGQ